LKESFVVESILQWTVRKVEYAGGSVFTFLENDQNEGFVAVRESHDELAAVVGMCGDSLRHLQELSSRQPTFSYILSPSFFLQHNPSS